MATLPCCRRVLLAAGFRGPPSVLADVALSTHLITRFYLVVHEFPNAALLVGNHNYYANGLPKLETLSGSRKLLTVGCADAVRRRGCGHLVLSTLPSERVLTLVPIRSVLRRWAYRR